MKWLVILTLVVSSLPVMAQDVNKNPNRAEPPIFGPHWARGAKPKSPASTNNDLSYHGGPILATTTVQAIFWGPSWGTSPGDKITGMDSFYMGEGGTSYAATVDEYKDTVGIGHQVSSSLTYSGHLVDTRALPRRMSSSAVLAEVCKEVPHPVADGYYPVYVDAPRNHANFCAYHSSGSCNGTPVEFGFFFKLDGDAGCNPGSTLSNQSEGLQALANVSGHELSETRSDPKGNAWYNSTSGEENSDQCAWTFGGPFVTFLNKTAWKIQGNWSNEANDGTSPNGPGYKTPQNGFGVSGTGCVDGSNFPGPMTK
jgi:hypothetical protein